MNCHQCYRPLHKCICRPHQESDFTKAKDPTAEKLEVELLHVPRSEWPEHIRKTFDKLKNKAALTLGRKGGKAQ